MILTLYPVPSANPLVFQAYVPLPTPVQVLAVLIPVRVTYHHPVLYEMVVLIG